MKGNK